MVEFLNNFAGKYARYTSFPIFVIDVLLLFSSPAVFIQYGDIYILLVLYGSQRFLRGIVGFENLSGSH